MTHREEMLEWLVDAAKSGDQVFMARAFADLAEELDGDQYQALLAAYCTAVGHLKRGDCSAAKDAILHYRPLIMEAE